MPAPAADAGTDIRPGICIAEEAARRHVPVRRPLEPIEAAARPLSGHARHKDFQRLYARAPDLPVDRGKDVLVHEREQPLAESLIGMKVPEPDQMGGDVVPGSGAG